MKIVPASDDYKLLISEKKIRGGAVAAAGFEAGLKSGTAGPVEILYYQGELKSSFAAGQLDEFFPRPARPDGQRPA